MHDSKSLKALIEKQLLLPIDEISVVELIDLIVEYAYVSRASDIHMDPTPDTVRVRVRIDGILHDFFEKAGIARALHHDVISRIKVLSGMRTDEHFIPQDGRFKVDIQDAGKVDIRVSIIPTYYGENVVMRLLAETRDFKLENLGLSEVNLALVKDAIGKPYGMILANGPTGSGKTTTLYTILKRLNRPEVAVITIEDPIEYSLDGMRQIQVNNKAGLTFANGLRAILRQDPNIIMVGEIRDQETAGIAVNAALTGHLVLSTLHTNDAATTFPRLLDMGVPPFLVASTVNIAMGQRLVRTLCTTCRVQRKLTPEEVKSLHEIIPEVDNKLREIYSAGKGCDKCDNMGYTGRTGIREVLEVNEDIRKLIMQRASTQEIKEAAVKSGMTTMVEDGIHKAFEGITSLEEVLRIIHE